MRGDVTIVIPVYNGGRYLNEAIESVKEQTSGEWRLLLIDDSSNDGSQEIMREQSDARIHKVYRHRNAGLYATLSHGLNLVGSEWVAVLMQDDRLKPFYLEEMFDVMRLHQGVQAFWATEDVIDHGGRVLAKGRNTRRLEAIEPSVEAWTSILTRGCIWTISGSFTHRLAFEAIPFRTDLPHCGDYDWLLRAIRKVRFCYYERALVELRQHDGQASTMNLRAGRDVREAYNVVRSNLSEHRGDLSRKVVWTICRRRIRGISRRLVTALVRGRLADTLFLLSYVARYLCLGVELRSSSPGPTLDRRPRGQ